MKGTVSAAAVWCPAATNHCLQVAAAAMSDMLQDPRIAKVWHFWVQLPLQRRQELLSVDLETLQHRASSLQEQAPAGAFTCVCTPHARIFMRGICRKR
jgi:hypothetical protein